jgi:hypothetical protein
VNRSAEPIPAPPAGEDIHMPGPSILPFVHAVSVTMMIIGVTLGWPLSVAGGVIFLVATFIWVRDVRRDISELPTHHHEGAAH